jgi:hypothetical protein
MHNIATAILEIKETGKQGARTRSLRAHIRKQLQMPKLQGEEHNGDLRAHGDALGGHGLGLDVKRQSVQGKMERVIPFTEQNIEICREFLDSNRECEIF